MVAMSRIEELARRIVEEFDPERIILFGSYAYGAPSKDSDVDFLVILPFEGSGLRKSVEILTRLSPDFPIDLISRRPEDVQRSYDAHDILIREAFDRGKVLHDRSGVDCARLNGCWDD
ncbi:MAG: nucleotidyltransferase domain-containing protein [Planctomycetes bacterium]|nr:nucleotidyltransferase domain-containing protein [Planctomycetota bacterium]MBI3833057.1 nucleotidyltransferase domain-containing protein [Planctomycetota bacterium]